MSNLGFNYGVGGLENMRRLAVVEQGRLDAERERSVMESKAQGQAIGTLVGAGVGMAKGAYDDYQQGEKDADVQRGVQARKDYGVLTDKSKPVDQRVSEVYGYEAADDIAARNDRVLDRQGSGVNAAIKQRNEALAKNGGRRIDGQSLPSMAAMNEVVGLEPRISQTGRVLGGKDTQLVSNNPWRDFLAGSKYFDGLLDR